MRRNGALPQAIPKWPKLRENTAFALFFYLGLPTLVGFLLGWTGAGQAGAWPKPAAVLVWVVVSVLGWCAADLGTRLVAPLFRAHRLPLAATLVAGVTLSGVVAVPLNFLVGEIFLLAGYPTRGLEALADYSLARAADALIGPLVVWTSVNLALSRCGGLTIYGYAPAAPERRDDAPEPPSAVLPEPTLLQHLRPALRGPVIALRAELHYVRVYTERGEDLVLYRFRDAVADLSGRPGAQVHRSWWVSAHAVVARRGGDRPCLRLSNGLEAPVSRTYAAVARALAPG